MKDTLKDTHFLIPTSFGGSFASALAAFVASVDGDVLATLAFAIVGAACALAFAGSVDRRCDFEPAFATVKRDRGHAKTRDGRAARVRGWAASESDASAAPRDQIDHDHNDRDDQQ